MLHGRYPNGESLSISPDGTAHYIPRHGDAVAGIGWLEQPAYSQFSIGTWSDWQRVRHLHGLRPGGFITVYPGRLRTLFDAPLIVGEEVVNPPAPAAPPRDVNTPPSDERPDETVLNSRSTASYSPFASSGAETLRLLASGEIRRIADDTPLPSDYELKTMHEVVRGYFLHPELKATKPYGIGKLEHKHVLVTGIEVNGIESNKIAQSAARDTAGILGENEQTGGRPYGSVTPLPAHLARPEPPARLASLLDEEMPDLLAASCLSRRTLTTLARSEYVAASALPETRAALGYALQLLLPVHPHSIAGWRDVLTVEALASLLATTADHARELLRGRTTWTQEERARLVAYMTERRTTVTQQPLDDAGDETTDQMPTNRREAAEAATWAFAKDLWKAMEVVGYEGYEA